MNELSQYLRPLWTSAKRHALVASLILAIAGVLMTIKVLQQQSIYEATCKIEFASTTPEVSLDSRSLLRYNSYIMQNLYLNGQLIVMMSDPVLTRVVNSLNLADAQKDPEAFQRAQRQIAGAVSINRITDTQVFTVQARHVNPKMAMDISNTVAETYIRYSYEKKIDTYKTSNQWLDDNLVDIKAKLEQSQRDLIAFVEKEKITSFGSEGNNHATVVLVPPAFQEVQTLLERLNANKVDEEMKLSRLKERYTEAHPDYKKAHSEIQLLSRKIKEQEERLRGLKAANEQEIIRAKKNEIEYSILSREVEVNKELYNALTRRHKETDIGSAVAQDDASVIERAKLPKAPSYPNKPLQISLAWLSALLLAVGYCFAMEHVDTTLKKPQDIEQHFQLPLLGVIGVHDKAGEADALNKDPHFGEAFRILRTNLNFSFPRGENGRLIMVGSTFKGEGKSTVVKNLARVTAELNRRTLLIDGDIRARSLSKHFEMENRSGLTTYLIGEARLEDVCLPTPIHNLTIIPAGHIPPQPPTLLDSKVMRDLLTKLRTQYDEIFIDTPPISVVIDSSIIASMVDGVVMITEAEKISRHDVKRAVQTLEKLKVRICGLVLNKMTVDTGSVYPYGSGYYGYYSSEPDSPASLRNASAPKPTNVKSFPTQKT